MSIRSFYPDATEPTPPRFNIGDLVYTNGYITIPPFYNGIDPSDTTTINNLMIAHSLTNEQVINIPSVFGIIIEYQDIGTPILDCSTIGTLNEWYGYDDPMSECELDLPDSGSIWFLPDNERRYFVKWFNKKPYPWTDKNTGFLPLLMDNGVPVFNKSLFPERYLFKAPDFLSKLRNKVIKRKLVEYLLNILLNIDHYSTKGITNIICNY